jgi:phosphate/sulfate permease
MGYKHVAHWLLLTPYAALQVFAFGMLCALVSAWIWVTLATYLEFAISTTHAVIGAIIGFGR